MKKVLCFILALIIAVAIPLSVGADNSEKCSCSTAPVVYVRGFGGGIYKVEEDGSLTNAFAFDASKMTPLIDDIFVAVFSLVFGNADSFAKSAGNILDGIMGDLACTYGGDSLYNIIPEESDSTAIDKHKNFSMDVPAEDREDAMYDFEYDWRLDPMVIADDLNTYIEEVKAVTGHDKVVIKCHSEGNCVAAAYLYKYGTASVEKFCFTAAAFNGINLVGQLFTKDISLKDKGTEIAQFVSSLVDGTESGEVVAALMEVLDDIGLLDSVGNLLQSALIENMLDTLYEEVLVDSFATWPALWTFVPDSQYENAKKAMFGDDAKYAALIKRIDDYHNNVQKNLKTLLTDAKANGVDIVFFAQYNFAPIPVYDNGLAMGDMLVETKYSSFGATTAAYGEKLDLDFSSPNAKYYSKDRLIDASTCLFPEYTWFIRGINHAVTAAYLDLTDWAILYDGQPTVFTDSDHPQFVYYVSDNNFAPVTEEIPQDNTNSFVKLIKAIADA
ncbi:MAG: hypothetical protein E7536_08220 [Ruminococcaceae bacterium]|nr:hypothetical protein [Oscillospiraceae bacterium]